MLATKAAQVAADETQDGIPPVARESTLASQSEGAPGKQHRSSADEDTPMKKVVRRFVMRRLFSPYLYFWARIVIRRQAPVIIAVTGSAGKTTTTDIVAQVLSHAASRAIVGPSSQTRNNMNDYLGIPLTLLRYEDWIGPLSMWAKEALRIPFRACRLAVSSSYPRLLVLEYGAGTKGDLARLAELAPPTVAVVTTIGPAHLERLKTIDGVVQEKGALVRAVPPSGLVILGTEHDYVAALEYQSKAPVIKVNGRGIELSRNIARIIARRLDIPHDVFEAALATLTPPKQRLTRLDLGALTVIDDSYNANPLSMRLGLDILAENGTASEGRRRVAILGFMAELGEDAPRYHAEIGAYAQNRANLIIGVGELAKLYHPHHWFPNSAECAGRVKEFIMSGDYILVKGSASASMARVVQRLIECSQSYPKLN